MNSGPLIYGRKVLEIASHKWIMTLIHSKVAPMKWALDRTYVAMLSVLRAHTSIAPTLFENPGSAPDWGIWGCNIRPIYIDKNQNPKNLGFLLYRLPLPEKSITFRFFGTKSACAKKPEISYWFFGKWCACATSLYLWPYVVRITSRAAVGWFRRRSRTTWPKTRIILARLEQAFTLAKNPEKPAEFQKIPLRRWVFRFAFFAVFRGSCLATSHKKPECTKDSGFFMQV